ncbi:MAG: NADH-quinone oxidoreductase subunit J [Flavobacteriia bacterium]|jgi:NADH-quinone oxidoreductase subunit J|nr:NADH-quinone oxidoreductase subunit J [Cryomorphaceae bacterium]NDE04793.1 NADH-quinone oxidoreductase subunit J [Flavobacteriia bacterium]
MSLQIISIILGSLTLASALMVVLSKHPVRSVIYLVVTFFFITSMYIMMNAQFLAIVNMIVYAGAIMVLFLFVLMLLNLNKEVEPMTTRGAQLAAFIAGGSLFLVLITALKDTLILGQSYRDNDSQIGLVKELGNLLFSKYIVAFELTSILFIAAMVGAILLAKREKQIIE